VWLLGSNSIGEAPVSFDGRTFVSIIVQDFPSLRFAWPTIGARRSR
jgi:hypothetical protein